MDDAIDRLSQALDRRFGDPPSIDPATSGLDRLAPLAAHRSQRAFADRPVPPSLLRTLCAVALSAPSKSDLQQRDIVIIEDADQRRRLHEIVPFEGWERKAPVLLVMCGNNRRQRQIHEWRGRPFVNDHLDAFFNAAVDAGIALAAFVAAADLVGLGTCPLSVVRNRAQQVSDLLALPNHVFPVAGLAVGWPAGEGVISPRLPLAATVHTDRFDESELRAQVEAYDARRAGLQPYARQRYVKDYGEAPAYGWSEDKARQYSKPERADFGAFVRGKGFRLD
jgi:nitroreductase/FMN reductase [NAD(P)H]